MRKFKRLGAAFVMLLLPRQMLAQAPCPGGGTLHFSHASDTPQAGITFNVGQKVILTAQPKGVAPVTYAWTVEGPALSDYNERIGSAATGGTVQPWSTTPLPEALSGTSISFYWKPAPSQVHPGNAGPVTRQVTLAATLPSGTCTVSRTFSVERNETDPDRQAVDYFTSNHRAPTESNLQKGVVIDDHQEWHVNVGTRLLGFLPWHREFILRFDRWLAEFGYPPVEPWDPGTPLPTGPDIDHSVRKSTYSPAANRIPTWYTLAGGAARAPDVASPNSGGQRRLLDFTGLAEFSRHFEYSWHTVPHCNVGSQIAGGSIFASMCYFSSPKDPLFWRWHKMVDLVYANYCAVHGLACVPGAASTSDIWMADNPADIVANGAVPSPGPEWASPDVWNRTTPAACTPAVARPGRATDPPRDCGSGADHQDPVAGTTNFLYATLRNDRPGAVTVEYAEVAVYLTRASSGFAWPADFGGVPDGVPLPETRQFITLNLQPGQSVDIGPIPWRPSSPGASGYWCAYVRVLSAQAPLGLTETASVWENVRGSNSIVWKTLKIAASSPGTGAGGGACVLDPGPD